MQAIITKQDENGVFRECGTTYTALVSHLTTERGVLKWAAGYAGGKPHRIQFFAANVYGEPFKTIYRG